MDELTFRLAYLAFCGAVMGLLLFLFSKKMDRRTFLKPVLYGFFFAFFGYFVLGGGALALLFGGMLVGYFLGSGIHTWWRFRAGGLCGSLFLVALFMPGSFLIINGTAYGILTSKLSDMLAALSTAASSAVGQAANGWVAIESWGGTVTTVASSAAGQTVTAEMLLQSLLVQFFLSAFLIVGIVAAGAVLGGMLRRFMVPSERQQPVKIEKA